MGHALGGEQAWVYRKEMRDLVSMVQIKQSLKTSVAQPYHLVSETIIDTTTCQSDGLSELGILTAQDDGARSDSTISHPLIGRTPDVMCADVDGNRYVVLDGKLRILILNPNGVPIAQILFPARADNAVLKVTGLAFFPDSTQMVIVARDELGTGGTMVFKARGLAKG